jgi:hypothetical protein
MLEAVRAYRNNNQILVLTQDVRCYCLPPDLSSFVAWTLCQSTLGQWGTVLVRIENTDYYTNVM